MVKRPKYSITFWWINLNSNHCVDFEVAWAKIFSLESRRCLLKILSILNKKISQGIFLLNSLSPTNFSQKTFEQIFYILIVIHMKIWERKCQKIALLKFWTGHTHYQSPLSTFLCIFSQITSFFTTVFSCLLLNRTISVMYRIMLASIYAHFYLHCKCSAKSK